MIQRGIRLIRYCSLCFLPDTKPDLYFDDAGLCAACISYERRPSVDWELREKEFADLVAVYANRSTVNWDCVIPVSGGKDSTVQVLKILELGFNPLCVTSTTCDLSPIGRMNIENIKNLGVDYIEFSPNPKIRRSLNQIGLREVGDIAWPEHVGIFTIPVQVAVKYKIPLIVWGENSQNEYGGPSKDAASNTLTRKWLEEFGGLLGLRVKDLSSAYGIEPKNLLAYQYPSEEELATVGVSGIFMGHYFPWDGLSNYLLAQANGFNSYGRIIEGSAVDYENLDNYQHGIHDYFKFLKFGYGRATDIVSMQIRRGRLTRKQGLEIIKKNDGIYPSSYLGKSLEEILSRIEISIEEFDVICNRFTNQKIFLTNSDGTLKKNGRNLVKTNYDNYD